MPLPIVMLAFGDRRYHEEALSSIDWHRQRGIANPIELWSESSTAVGSREVRVRPLPAVASSAPSYVVGWYHKTRVLREKCREQGAFCFLDAYARILRPELFDAMQSLAERFSICLSLDPRRTIGTELSVGRGIGPELRAEMGDVPATFPLWNTGVVFAAPSIKSQSLCDRVEELSRTYLERGWKFREQVSLVRAVIETGIAPLTLPDNYNVKRPFIDPAIVLHTRRYGHFYGVPEVDTEAGWAERLKHHVKATATRLFRARSLFPG